MTATVSPSTDEKPAHRSPGGSKEQLLRTVLVAIPDRLVVAVVCLAAVISVSMVAGYFSPPLVIVVTVLLIAATWRLAPSAYVNDDKAALGSALALVLAVAWFWVNRHYAAQQMSVARDPSVYTLRGWWMWHHTSPNIPAGSAIAAAKDVPTSMYTAGGFTGFDGKLQGQGATLLPGLLGLAGWVGGAQALLQANVAIGSAALLSVYAFARRLVGPLWALVPTVALAVCVPMFYFSRAEYTEPVALLFVFGGMTMLWSAWGAVGRRSALWRFGFAGFTIGASQIARIDGLVAVLGGAVGIGAVAIFARSTKQRRRGQLGLVAYSVGAAVTVALGTLDLKLNSVAYLHSESDHLRPLFLGSVVVIVLMVVLSVLPLGKICDFLGRRAHALALSLGGVAVVAIAVLISRPLWWKGHFINEPAIKVSLTHYQVKEGLAVDGTRSYDEQTIKWISWYFGWPAVVLCAAGLVWLLYRAALRRDPRLVCFLSVVGTVGILYLNDVSITPIQIWAMRRFLPVLLPGLLIAATWLCAELVRKIPSLLWVGGVLAAGLAVSPLIAWNSLITVPEQQGEYNEVMAACNHIHTDRVVLSGIPASGYYLPSLRIVCGVKTVYLQEPTAANLAQVRRQWGGKPLDLIAFSSGVVTWSTPPTAFHSAAYPYWPSLISARPAQARYETRTMYAGTVQADGSVVPDGPA